MRKRTVRKLQTVSTRLRRFSKQLFRIKNLQELRPYCFDAVPIEFHYDRLDRSIKLILGIEVERLLAISMETDLKEKLLMLYEVFFRLRPHRFAPLGFRESFCFVNGDGNGQELIVKKIARSHSLLKLKKMGLLIPRAGYLIHFTGIDFLCLVEKLSDVMVRPCKVKRLPAVISLGNIDLLSGNGNHPSFLQLTIVGGKIKSSSGGSKVR